jgi:hypothetical protein
MMQALRCVRLTTLNFNHFKVVEGMGLKVVASTAHVMP